MAFHGILSTILMGAVCWALPSDPGPNGGDDCSVGASTPWAVTAETLISFTKQVDPPTASKLLPAGLSAVLVPSTLRVWSNASVASVTFTRYSASPVGAYNELTVSIQANHHATNTTGGLPVAVYNDNPRAASCSMSRWGVSAQTAHFAYSSGSLPVLGKSDTVTVKASDSIFAKLIAKYTYYHNVSAPPPPAPVDPSLCQTQWAMANCTLSFPHITTRAGALLAWQREHTGEVAPAFSALEVSSQQPDNLLKLAQVGSGLSWSGLYVGNNQHDVC